MSRRTYRAVKTESIFDYPSDLSRRQKSIHASLERLLGEHNIELPYEIGDLRVDNGKYHIGSGYFHPNGFIHSPAGISLFYLMLKQGEKVNIEELARLGSIDINGLRGSLMGLENQLKKSETHKLCAYKEDSDIYLSLTSK